MSKLREFSTLFDQDAEDHISVDPIVIQFFVAFSRFEYALKRSRYVSGQGGYAKPMWNMFAASIEDQFDRHKSGELSEAIDFLTDHPPKKQVVRGAQLDWVDSEQGNMALTEWVSKLIRVVRNNLFHGEKMRLVMGMNPERGRNLVRSSLVVLLYWLDLDDELKRIFYAGQQF